MNKACSVVIGSLLLAACALSQKRQQYMMTSESAPPIIGVDKYALVGPYKVHYVDAGRGDPLILIPGSFFSYREWHRVMPLLAKDFRLLAIDYIGVGQSDKPIAGFDYSVQAQAEIIHGLMDVLGISKANVMGVSYGGSIAIYLGARWPERINKVVSIEGFTNLTGQNLPWIDRVLAILKVPLLGDLFILLIQTGLLDAYRAAIIKRQERFNFDERERREVEQMIRASSRSATRWSWLGIANARHTSTLRHLAETDLRGNLSVPILHLVGTHSIFRKPMQLTLKELATVPAARVVTIEGGSHDMQLQKPGLVANAVRAFLSTGA